MYCSPPPTLSSSDEPHTPDAQEPTKRDIASLHDERGEQVVVGVITIARSTAAPKPLSTGG